MQRSCQYMNPASWVITIYLLVGHTACSSSTTDNSAAVVKLSASDVAALLGLQQSDGLKLGDVESDSNGVRLSEIAFQNSSGKDVEIKKINLRIETPEDLVYQIAELQVDQIDFHDWKSNQRTKATSIKVSHPGPGFIPAIEEAIASTNSGTELTTGSLAFKKLEIGKIDYVIRAPDSSLTRAGVHDFSITDATADSLGSLSVGKIFLGESVSVQDLRVTNVNRKWADFLLGSLSRAKEPGENGEAADTSRTLDLGDRVVPFDRFHVDQFAVRFPDPGDPEKYTAFNIKVFEMNIDRSGGGDFLGLTASASIDIPLESFPTELKQMLQSLNRSAFANGATADASFRMKFDRDKRIESFDTIAFSAPHLFSIEGSMITRSFATSLAKLLVQRDVEEDIKATMLSSLTINYNDDGLLSYLVSERHDHSKSVKDDLREMRKELADGSDSSHHAAEIARFIDSPRRISLRVTADSLVPAEQFFNSIFRSKQGDTHPDVKATLSFDNR